MTNPDLTELARLDLERAELRAEVERLRKACNGEPHTCDQERIAAAEGKTDRLIVELAERNAQLDATRNAIGAECVEHVEMNGHLDIAKELHDHLCHEAIGSGDPSGKLQDFVAALRIVIDQCDRQRRRANWYEVAYTAGKSKVIESAVERALSRARAAAQVYAVRVDALGLAADDNDPRVMATAFPIGEAQADLFATLGLLERSESGEVVVNPPTETIEQLRAERDAARMHVDVRGTDIDSLSAQLAAVQAERDEVREAALLPIRRALFLRGHCGDGGLAPMVERALDEARQRGRDENREVQDTLLEASDAFPPDMEGTVAARVKLLVDERDTAIARAETAENGWKIEIAAVHAARKEVDEARMLHRDAQIRAEDRGKSYQAVIARLDDVCERCQERCEHRHAESKERE